VTAKRAVATDRAPGAIGPYSQGSVAGDLIFTSGQIPMTPAGELVTADIGAATRQCLENLMAVVVAGGGSPSDVLKVTIFLTDMADFDAVNAEYEAAFASPYPARSCVEVAALPKGVPIEIEAIARIGS